MSTARDDRGVARPALAGALAYLAGQSFNFGFQLLLLRALGPADYGRVGLAHLVFVTILFFSDLSYGLVFLRERPGTAQWKNLWRIALGHRLLAALLAWLAAAGFWLARYGAADQGLAYLLVTAPAAFAALLNFSAPLLAAGRHAAGFAAQQIAWPVAAVCFGLAWATGWQPLPPVLLAGACVSLGYAIQAALNLAMMRALARPTEGGVRLADLVLPRFGRGGRLLKAALSLSALALLGIANERLTAFLVESAAVAFLPAYLLLVQLLGGGSGALAQLNRLLVAAEARGHAVQSPAGLLAGFVLTPLAALLVLAVAGCTGGCSGVPAQWLRLGEPVLLGWTIAALGGAVAAVLIGRHREAQLARAVAAGVAISMAGQAAGAWLGQADAVLWARVAGDAAALGVTARLCGTRVPGSLPLFGLAVAFAAAAQAQAALQPAALALAGVALLASLKWDAVPAFRAWRGLRAPRAAGAMGVEGAEP